MRSIYKGYPTRCDSVSNMHILRSVDKINLLRSIFEGNVNNSPPGCGLQLNNMLLKKIALSHFPVDVFGQLVDLESKWLKFCSRSVSVGKDIK